MSYLEDQGFKAGDTIVCVSTGAPNIYKVGDEFTIEVCLGGYLNIPVRGNLLGGSFGKWKLKVDTTEDYTEGQWYPFTGTLPEVHTYECMMADGSYHEFKSGSGVTPNMGTPVAFRVLQNLKPEPVVTKEYMTLCEHSALGIITITKEDGIITGTSYEEVSRNVS
tara:strand:- start:1260 stop:1754 length:495 start_codon:yes stop_codon:yes gene_type:complete